MQTSPSSSQRIDSTSVKGLGLLQPPWTQQFPSCFSVSMNEHPFKLPVPNPPSYPRPSMFPPNHAEPVIPTSFEIQKATSHGLPRHSTGVESLPSTHVPHPWKQIPPPLPAISCSKTTDRPHRDTGETGGGSHPCPALESTHSVFPAPLSCCVLVALSICLVDVRNFGHKRVIGVRIGEKRTDGQQNLRYC